MLALYVPHRSAVRAEHADHTPARSSGEMARASVVGDSAVCLLSQRCVGAEVHASEHDGVGVVCVRFGLLIGARAQDYLPSLLLQGLRELAKVGPSLLASGVGRARERAQDDEAG